MIALFGLVLAGVLLRPFDVQDRRGACPAPEPEPANPASSPLPDLPSGTVIASLEGDDITLGEVRRYREGKLAGLPSGEVICDAALLELIIRRHFLAGKARSRGGEKTGAFRDRLARFRELPEAAWMTEEDLEKWALAETFLEQEVIARMDIRLGDIEEMYGIFEPMMPEGTTLEEARPLFESRLRRQAVERYLRDELDRRPVSFHESWLRHVRQQPVE